MKIVKFNHDWFYTDQNTLQILLDMFIVRFNTELENMHNLPVSSRDLEVYEALRNKKKIITDPNMPNTIIFFIHTLFAETKVQKLGGADIKCIYTTWL